MKAFFQRITRHYHSPDFGFIVLLGLILVLGLIFLTSASGIIGLNRFGSVYFFLQHQLIYGLIPGLILLVFFSYFDYHSLRKIALPALILSGIFCLMVFLPKIGLSRGDARRWINLFGFSFQPSEFLKLALLLYLASLFDSRRKKIGQLSSGLIPLAIILVVVGAIIMAQKDMGTMMVIFVIAVSLYFLAGAKLVHFFVLIGAAGSAFLILMKAAPYRMARFLTFLYPQMDPLGVGYHINQALIAIGSGGILGLGLGHSRQKFLYLPESYGDSIFAVIGEEMGFLFTILFIGVLLVFVLRGLKITRRAPDFFGQLLAGGIMAWFIFQTMINMGAMLHLFPLTGIPLPLVSYGGTAMTIFLAAFGILINISRQTKE